MSIIKMKKVYAIVMDDQAKAVLRAMQSAGVLELSVADTSDPSVRIVQNAFKVNKLESELADVRKAIGVIKEYDHTKKGFLTPLDEISARALKHQSAEDPNVAEALRAANEIESKAQELRQRKSRALNAINQVKPFEKLDIPVSDLVNTRGTAIFCGYLPKENLDNAMELARKSQGLTHIELLGEDEFAQIFVAAHGSESEEIKNGLKELSFGQMRFDGFRGTCKERIAELEADVAAIDKEMLAVQDLAAKAAAFSVTLKAYEDFLSNKISREQAYAKLATTDTVSIIEGYVMHTQAQKLEEVLKGVSDVYYLQFADPAEDDDVPTAIVNGKGIRPFEAVTDMYATPGYKGLDPIKVLAPFFFVLFGMMLSDAAYGVMLIIGSIVILKVKKPTGMFKNVTTVIGYCGVSTIIWGLMFGSIFSIEGVSAILFNPMDQAINMLLLCIGIGWLHLIFALGTGFYVEVRDGSISNAICDKLSWMLVLLAIPLVLLLPSVPIGMIMVLLGLGIILFTGGRHSKSIVGKVVGGLAKLYDITAYLSDLLSYSRIFGMALATSVIGMVFNEIGGMMMGGIMIVFAVIILAVGHVFNIGISAMGAYVHSARLQYIESFGKFFEAGGRPFAPLTYKSKNFRINKDI